jgi:hypothetical protein
MVKRLTQSVCFCFYKSIIIIIIIISSSSNSSTNSSSTSSSIRTVHLERKNTEIFIQLLHARKITPAPLLRHG